MAHTPVLARLAATGIYLLRGIPRDLQRAARHRAANDGTTLRVVLLQGLREYAAGSWTPQIHDQSFAPRTHVEPRGAADIQRKAVRSNAVENVARGQAQKTLAAAIQGHLRASGQRLQAKRDAR